MRWLHNMVGVPMLLNCTLKKWLQSGKFCFTKFTTTKSFPKAKNKTKILEEASGPQFTSSISLPSHRPTGQASPPPLCTWGQENPATHTEPTSGSTGESQAPTPQPIMPPSTCSQTACNSADQGGHGLGQKAEGYVSLKTPLRLLSKWCHVSKIGFIRCRQYPSQQIGVEEKKQNRTGSLTELSHFVTHTLPDWTVGFRGPLRDQLGAKS